ncbi:excinuclease ABC subunit C [Enterococcus faecalis]
MENFMKKFNYQGAVIKDNNKISGVAYVQCTCGCLASRVSTDSDKYKCSWCKRVYALRKEIRTTK